MRRKVDHKIDGLMVLTTKELDELSKMLGADVVHAITTPTAKRMRALTLVAWKLARRLEPHAALATYEVLNYVDVHDSIYRSACVIEGLDPDEEEDVPDDEGADDLVPETDSPVEPEGADPDKIADLSDDGDVDPEVAANPTAPARGSSSPARGGARRKR